MTTGARTGENPLGYEKIGKLIVRFSVPAIVSMLVNAIYNIVDQIFIGPGIGTPGMAATNVAFPLVTLCTAVALLFGIGGASFFNLKLGAGETESAGRAMGASITLLVIVGTVLGLLSVTLLDPMLWAFGATETIMPFARPYTLIFALGVPCMVFATGAAHLIRADGSPTYAMISMVSGAVFNLVFDPIFLFALDMGIEGIALATTLSQVLSASISVYYFLRKFKSMPLKKEYMRPRAKTGKAICALGMAAFVNQMAMAVVQVAMNNMLSHYGALSVYGSEIPLAGAGAIAKINFLFMGITIGIAQGCQPINGFNYGAKKYGRVIKTYRTALLSATLISVFFFLIFQLFPHLVIEVFGRGDQLYFEFSVRYLRIFMLATFINGLQPVASNFFTSIGRAKLGVFMSLTRQVIFLLPLVLILPVFFGIEGVLYSGPIADAAAALLAFLFSAGELRTLRKMKADL